MMARFETNQTTGANVPPGCYSKSGPMARLRAALGLIGAGLIGAGLIASCGNGAEPTAPKAEPASPTRPVQPRADSAGRLEVVDPENPRRPYFFDFGEVTWGNTIDWDARMVNVGPEPMELHSAQPACGCTVIRGFTVLSADGEEIASASGVSITRPLTIPPGATLVIRQQLVTESTFANQNKLALVRFHTTSSAEPFITFEVRFIPMRRFYHDRNGLQARAIPTSHGGEAKLKLLTRSSGEQMRVLGIADAPDGFTMRVEELSQSGQLYWLVYMEIPPLTPIGFQRGSIDLITTDDSGQGDEGRYRVPYIVNVVADVSATPTVPTFGLAEVGTPVDAECELRALVPGARVGVKAAHVEGLDGTPVEITFEPEKPDAAGRSARWAVRASAPEGLPAGKVVGTLVLELDEPFGGGTGEGGTLLELRLAGLISPKS